MISHPLLLFIIGEEYRGGALLNSLCVFLDHGDPQISSFASTVLSKASKPFWLMMKRWIEDGEVQDANEEFFVQRMDHVMMEESWVDAHKVRQEMVPAFMDANSLMEKVFSNLPLHLFRRCCFLPRQIFMIGKSVNFIRHNCKDSLWKREIACIKENGAPEEMFFGFSVLFLLVLFIQDRTKSPAFNPQSSPSSNLPINICCGW